MAILKRAEEYIDGLGLTTVFLSVFLFFQPFGGLAGVRNTAFVLLCLVFAVKLARGSTRIDLRDPSSIGFLLIVGASVLSTALSPYPMESLDAMRKNLFYQAVVFFAIAGLYSGYESLKPLIHALILGFASLSVFVIFKYDPEVFLNWLRHSDIGDAPLLKGYSLYATFYIPFAVAYLYASRGGWRFKAALVFFIFLESALSFLNNHRTQIVAIAASAGLITLVAGRYRVLLIGLALVMAAGLAAYETNPQAFDRYGTLLNPHTYVTDEHRGLNDRLAIWKGALEMVKDRPATGWGYGWKKLSTVAKEQGYIERWDKAGRTYAYYSEKGYGSANPHNLAIQILFEIGAFGLLSFLFFWGTVAAKAAFAPRTDSGAGARLLKYGASGVLVSYLLINYTNGLWEESFGILMMSFAAFIVVLYRESASREAHSG